MNKGITMESFKIEVARRYDAHYGDVVRIIIFGEDNKHYQYVHDIYETETAYVVAGKMNWLDEKIATYDFVAVHDNVDFGRAKRLSAKLAKIAATLKLENPEYA